MQFSRGERRASLDSPDQNLHPETSQAGLACLELVLHPAQGLLSKMLLALLLLAAHCCITPIVHVTTAGIRP